MNIVKTQGSNNVAVATANIPIPIVASTSPHDDPGEAKQQQKLRVEDDKRAIAFDTPNVKGGKLEFITVKARL